MKAKTQIILLFVIGILPFELNGIYNRFILDSPFIFWSLEMIFMALLPLAIFIYCIKSKIVTTAEIGFRFKIYEKYDNKINSIILLSLILFTTFLLYYGYGYFYKLAIHIFPIDYLNEYYAFYDMIPEDGFLKFIAITYFALTAGFVEEFYYRGLFFNVFSEGKYKYLLYILISSLIFSSVHWESGVRNLFATFLFGVITCSIYVKTKNLWPLVVGHFCLDFILFYRF